jgi:hypothetical protein
MGDDFSALLEYRGVDAAVERMITRLESGYEPPEVTRVVDFGRAEGFGFADRRRPVRWAPWEDCENPLRQRPKLPDVSVRLALQSDFFLTFGRDAIWVYHTLRWQFFCCDPHWQDVMVPAMNWFREAFGATDAVVTWDCSRPVGEFRCGVSFDRALRAAVEAEEPEVEVGTPDQLYWLEEDGSETAMQPTGGILERVRRWPRDKPLPSGWYRPQTIHWRGWWRPPRRCGSVT